MTEKNRLQFIYILNQTMHWFIVGIFVPVNALLVVEKGLDSYSSWVLFWQTRSTVLSFGSLVLQ